MTRKSYYLKFEEPINRGEFIEHLYNSVFSYGICNSKGFSDIPDRSQVSYKQHILNIFFQEYVFGEMYIPKEIPAGQLTKGLDFKQYAFVKNSLHTRRDNKQYEFLLVRKLDLFKREKFYKTQDRVRYVKSLHKCLQGNLQLIVGYNNEKQCYIEGSLEDLSHFPDYTEYYIKDLKDTGSGFWDTVHYCILDAQASLRDLSNKVARDTFKAKRQSNLLAFAKSLYVYAQVLRYMDDVPKIANRFVEMGRFMDGETNVRSIIMCYFNTDQNTGRNGKTYRMFGEEDYLKANGFITSNASLSHTRIQDINIFKNNFFYKDEYSFKDTNAEFLKTINKNYDLKITADVMYRGECTVQNPAIFYLAAHNGKINSKLESNERCLTAIRFSDAKYEENKGCMTYIYNDLQEAARLPEQTSANSTVTYIAELYHDITTMTMTELFDGLLKYSKGITIPKELLTPKQPKMTNSLSIAPELIEFLQANCLECPNDMSFVRIYTKLAKGRYYNNESAKQEVKKLYQFLNDNFPHFIHRQSAANWDNKTLNICSEMLAIVEEAIGNATADTEYSLINQKELWLYIINMLGIDPNTPISDLQEKQLILTETEGANNAKNI